MKIHNLRREAVLVVLQVNGRAGIQKMIMKDTPEELRGPVFMKGLDGQDLYMTIPGEIIVAYPGASNAGNIICLDFAPVAKSWIDTDGANCRLVVWDYRYKAPERPSR